MNACERKDSAITHRLSEGVAYRSLVQAERAGLDLERFSFGDGLSRLVTSETN